MTQGWVRIAMQDAIFPERLISHPQFNLSLGYAGVSVGLRFGLC